jgi:hypothetical protein
MDNPAGVISPDITNPTTNSPVLNFREVSLPEMVDNLERYYNELRSFINRPGIIRHDELVLLRRRAAQADIGSTFFNRFQAQLRLAVELMRLGRRAEGFLVLSQIEQRIAASAESKEMQPVTVVYGLWLALMQAAVGNTYQAFEAAQRLASTIPDSVMSGVMLAFFRNLYQNS